jgi:hypothetical protein
MGIKWGVDREQYLKARPTCAGAWRARVGPGSPTGAHRAPVSSVRPAELAKNTLTCTDNTLKEDLAL